MVSMTYDEVISYHNLKMAAKGCCKGVSWKPSVQLFVVNRLQWVATLYDLLKKRNYKSRGFYKFWLVERGKLRFIQSVHISERTVQKCLNNNGVKPVVVPTLIYDNGASLEGKGTDFAIKRLRQHLASHFRRHGKSGGILLIDMHDYFNSIPHNILLTGLQSLIPDDEVFALTKYFIDVFGDTGLGLGSEVSQICAVYYLSAFDHYVKEKLHIKGYGRYMDDMYLIHENVEYLKKCLGIVYEFMASLGLEVNPKTQICVFEKESFVYLKHRFHISNTGKIVTRPLRENMRKRRRVLQKQKNKLEKKEACFESINQSYQSYRGYANKWNNYEPVQRLDDYFYDLFKEELNYDCRSYKRV